MGGCPIKQGEEIGKYYQVEVKSKQKKVRQFRDMRCQARVGSDENFFVKE